MKKFVSLFCFAISLITGICAFAYSADDIFEAKSEYLILGTIKDVDEENVTVTVDNIVGQGSTNIKNTDISISKFMYSYCEDHTSAEFNKPKLGDNIFASLKPDGTSYVIAGGAYKVDSSEIKNCSTIVYRDMNGEDCLNEAVKISYFIRTNGKITEFETDSNGSIYALSNNDKILIYPLPGNECVKFVDKDGKIISDEMTQDVIPIVPNTHTDDVKNDNRWIIAIGIISVGALLGFVFFYFLYAKKRL